MLQGKAERLVTSDDVELFASISPHKLRVALQQEKLPAQQPGAEAKALPNEPRQLLLY